MNWLDTQTKEILQKDHGAKLAPPRAAEFALVLVRKGSEHHRMVRAISEINKCSETDAARCAAANTPVTINSDLTEEDALWAQFELTCCDAISVFVRSEVLEQSDQTYLHSLFQTVLHSVEFRPTTIRLTEVPRTESGERFVDQFLGITFSEEAFPMSLEVPFKKARIMEHWATRVGAQIQLDAIPNE